MGTDSNRCSTGDRKRTWLWRICLFGIAATVWILARPGSFAAEDAQTVIYRYILDEMDLSPAAACGIMGNMQAESMFNPGIAGVNGVGLCQWTGVRASRLHAFCSAHKLDSMTAEGQVAFIHYELQNYFPQVYGHLQSVSNNADGAYSAAYYFCVRFEAPANAASMGAYRGSLARNVFWPEFGQTKLYLKAAPAKNGIALTWTGKVNEKQVIMRARDRKGTFEKIATVRKNVRTYLDKTVKKQKKYCYYVCTESEYKKYVKKKKEAPGRSNKYEVTSAKSVADDECIILLSQRSYEYNGKARKPKITVRYGGKRLKTGRDFKVRYLNNWDAGRASVVITGAGSYTGMTKRTFTIEKAALKYRVKNLWVRLSAKTAMPRLKVRGISEPRYRLFSTSDRTVASFKKSYVKLKSPGIVYIGIKIYGDENHKSAVTVFRVTVRR